MLIPSTGTQMVIPKYFQIVPIFDPSSLCGRRGAEQLFVAHVAALRELLLGAAVADVASWEEAGPASAPTLRQLAALLGRLLQSCPESSQLPSGFTCAVLEKACASPLSLVLNVVCAV